MASSEFFLWRAYDPDLPHTKTPDFDPLAGEGASLFPGRWHTPAPGKRLVYAAEHSALAPCELLAHAPGLGRVALVGFRLRTPGIDEVEVEAALLRPEGIPEAQALGAVAPRVELRHQAGRVGIEVLERRILPVDERLRRQG